MEGLTEVFEIDRDA